MGSITCPSCGRRKGRRACPALGRPICTVCCGSKRLVEIRCPSDCAYLAVAEQHPPAVVQRRRERQGRWLASVVDGLTQAQYQLFLFVQVSIAAHATRAAWPLLDRDVEEAARALASTFETASKGIIYEHQAASLPAQRLAADVRAAIEALGREGRPARDDDVASALQRTERAAQKAGREFGGERAYLDLLAELFPKAAERAVAEGGIDAGPRASGLIIP